MLRRAGSKRFESQTPRCASTLKYWGVESRREVHWYHDFRMGGGFRDGYEVYRKDGEFGQSEITDKDRYPHLYWNIWKGRTTIKRVIDQFGYSKDLKPEKLKYESEKIKYFRTLDSLNFLEFTRTAYQYLDDDARGAVGYITEDEVEELRSHTDFGRMYADCSEEYRNSVLRDPCDGRPVYEWQVPYGLDEAHGYRDVSTAVDILGNPEATKNLNFRWTPTTNSAESAVHGNILTNQVTRQELLICDESEAAAYVSNYKPDVVVFQRGAEKLLMSLKTKMSPTCPTDLNGLALCAAWSTAFCFSPLWPETSLMGAVCGLGLVAANSYVFHNVCLSDQYLKNAMAACRGAQCDVVFGDWLRDDYDERQHHVKEFDELALRASTASQARRLYLDAIQEQKNDTNPVRRFFKTVANSNLMAPETQHPTVTSDKVAAADWMQTYKDAVNDKRMDILAHVSNNVDGARVLVATRAFDNISAAAVSKMLESRMTGAYAIERPPLEFDGYYERVRVAF